MKGSERWLGGLLVLAAVGLGATARTFSVGFLVDPLGPKALPYLVAGLFLVGGMALLCARTSGEGSDEGVDEAIGVGEDPGPRPGEERDLTSQAGGPWRAQGVALLILLGYAAALPLLGFVASTALATGALSKVFSGRFLQGLGVGLALGLGLFGLFTLGFGMELPPGVLLGGEL